MVCTLFRERPWYLTRTSKARYDSGDPRGTQSWGFYWIFNMLEQEITIHVDRRWLSFGLSLIFHVLLILTLNIGWDYLESPEKAMEKTTPMVVESINQEMLEAMKNMKTVGIKGGNKDSFAAVEAPTQIVPRGSYGIAQPKNAAKSVLEKLESLEKTKTTTAQHNKVKPTLDLSKLAIPKNDETPNLPAKKPTLKSVNLQGSEIREFLKNDNLSAPMLNPQANPFLANSNIDVKMEVPEGVDVSELNEYELQFYSFQKRTATSYISSFYKNLDRFVTQNPQVRFPLTTGRETMTGRVTFDKEGNIKQIKMIRWSNSDKMQDFFQEVLEGINRLPNPPKALVKETGQFNIYYTLIING